MNLPQTFGELDDLAEEVYRGRRKLHELPEHLSIDQTARVRRKALERRAEWSLDVIGSYSMDMAAARCEHLIGAVQVPLGVVGPLSARGCRAIRDAGGAPSGVEDVGMTRAPVFRSEGIEQTRRFLEWVVHASVHLPDMPLAAIGGGTVLGALPDPVAASHLADAYQRFGRPAARG